MVINMLHNWNHRYSNHNSNIKCVGSTQIYRLEAQLKCISFEPIHYAINPDDVSFSMIFSDFDYMFLSMHY